VAGIRSAVARALFKSPDLTHNFVNRSSNRAASGLPFSSPSKSKRAAFSTIGRASSGAASMVNSA